MILPVATLPLDFMGSSYLHICTRSLGRAKKKGRLCRAAQTSTKEISQMKSNNSTMGVRINVSGNIISICNCHSYDGIGSMLDTRGEVEGFSESSSYRMRRYLRETRAEYRAMVTVTYPEGFGKNGERSKNDLRRFLQELRRYGDNVSRETWGSFWFMEFQSNGKIHYHILVTDYYPYQWIATVWYRIVGSGDPKHLVAGTRIESLRLGRNGIASYAAKYANKFDQKLVPENFGWVGRFWGVQGYCKRVAAATWVSAEAERHAYVQESLKHIFCELNRLKNEGKAKNITEMIKNVDTENMQIICVDQMYRGECEKLMYKVRFLELWLAIHEGREPKVPDDDLEMMYDTIIDRLDYEDTFINANSLH